MAGSGEDVGCVPQGLKALTGPPVSSSPHFDCILVAKAGKGPNGPNFTGPMVISVFLDPRVPCWFLCRWPLAIMFYTKNHVRLTGKSPRLKPN